MVKISIALTLLAFNAAVYAQPTGESFSSLHIRENPGEQPPEYSPFLPHGEYRLASNWGNDDSNSVPPQDGSVISPGEAAVGGNPIAGGSNQRSSGNRVASDSNSPQEGSASQGINEGRALVDKRDGATWK